MFKTGSADMKANLRGDMILAAVVDEENLSIGTEQVLKAWWHADGVVVPELSLMDIVLSTKGVDAIARAGHFLVELDRHSQALLQGKAHPSVGSTGSIFASLITGGEEPSSYPAKCTITIERRTVPGETTQTATQEICAILNSVSTRDQGFKSEVRITFSRPHSRSLEEDSFIKTVIKNVKHFLGSELVIRPEAAWTDCALLAEKGIPAALFGPAGEGFRATREWATVESIETVTDALERIAVEFCS